MAIRFSYADKTLPYGKKQKLKKFLEVIASKEGFSITELVYVFCSDDYLLDINRRFLQHDYFTDIITFDLREDVRSKSLEGEIYISIDRLVDNAQSLNVSFEEELCRVVFHGLLHLCGYNDKRKADVAKMRAAEDLYIGLYKESL
jgi:probable rRNA maturation factor